MLSHHILSLQIHNIDHPIHSPMGSLFAPPKQPLLFHIGTPEPQPSNTIKTTSYNIFTFLPLSQVATLIQFKRLANVYFLVTAVLQFVPAISPLSPVSAIAPLIFVLTVSLIRAAVEEIGKYRYDREANSNQFLVYVEKEDGEESSQLEGYSEGSNNSSNVHAQWQSRRSDQLHVGDIIKIEQNQRFPADIIILATSSPDGKAFIETSSLDGQKNLKIRSVLPATQQLYNSLESIRKIQQKKPLLTIEQPNQQLYSFNAVIEYTKQLDKPLYGYRNKRQQKHSQFLKINQFLYRQAVLRSTAQIIGVITYVGRYTKSMMNSTGGRDKMSKLERKVNFYMIFIFILQFVLILLCGLLRVLLFYNTVNSQQFIKLVLRMQPRSSIIEGVITSCSYFILLNTMIPISLLVSIEIVKFGQGIFISYDKLISKKNEKDGKITYSRAFRSSINEELGMIQYVFTDKTGTLTRNEMLLKEIVIGGNTYLNEPHAKNKLMKDYYYNSKLHGDCYKSAQQYQIFIRQLKTHFQFLTSPQKSLSESASILQTPNSKTLNTLMLLLMSACHECLLISGQKNGGVDQYHGSSPDEITLVDSASQCGYKFMENSFDIIRINLGNGNIVKFRVEDIFEFNSDRKRMSIVLSTELLNGWKIVFCKGADSAIDGLLRSEYKDQSNPVQFQCYEKIKLGITENSKTGLRTLLFGYKPLSQNEYKELKRKIVQYSDNTKQSSTHQKDKSIIALQQNLYLIGSTAVQDRLQDQVQQTIEDMIKANIKVCMLTGDKLETAENIAKSCRLFKGDWKIVRIKEGSGEVDVFRGYCQVRDYLENGDKYGILVQGSAITTALNSIYFSEIFQNSSASVCCRITPKNKAQMVLFAKDHLNKLVLAIGDGANDVPMIQAANIGIGLYGNQGMNAVQASDFALPEFKGLWRLLFVHGRWNYFRIAELVKYFFYKNMVFTLGQLWFAYLCGFSGTSIYDATYLALYNTIFTGGPVLVRALLEQDLNYIQIIEQMKQEEARQKLKRSQNSQLQQQLLEWNPSMKSNKQIINSSISSSEKRDDRFIDQSHGVKKVSKLAIDNNLKRLFPLLYSHSQQQQSLTPRLFVLLILQSIIESFCIFLTIYFGIEAPQLWIYSICLYTVILALVTIRICYDINYWTWLMVAAILFTSVLPYLGFVYVMSVFQASLAGTFVEIVQLPDFYLCLFLALGAGAFVQATFNVVNKYYFPSAIDIVRQEWKKLQKQEAKEAMLRKEERKEERRRTFAAKYHEILQSSRSMKDNLQFELRQINTGSLHR